MEKTSLDKLHHRCATKKIGTMPKFKDAYRPLGKLEDYGLTIDDFGYVMIDWLSVYQVYPFGSVPVLGSDMKVTADFTTGEIKSEMILGFQHEGSFDTSIRVRSDGSRVEVSGNPSAFCRQENVFGFQSVQECIDVFNKILLRYDLPPFKNYYHDISYKSKPINFIKLAEPVRYKSNKVTYNLYNGYRTNQFSLHNEKLIDYGKPIITQIHITQNIETGSEIDRYGDIKSNAHLFLRHLSSYNHRKKPGFLFPNGNTVVWNVDKNGKPLEGNRVYHKYYGKAYDVQSKIDKLLKKKAENEVIAIDIYNRLDYLSSVKEWCDKVGLIRNEVELKPKEIADHNLRYIEDWSYKTMCEVIRPFQFHNKIKVEQTNLDNIYPKLINDGYSEKVASFAQLILTAWINCNDLSIHLKSPATYYRYRNILLENGVDIAKACDLTRIPLRVQKLEWKNSVPPDFYQLPKVA